jgi:hypothetical protein
VLLCCRCFEEGYFIYIYISFAGGRHHHHHRMAISLRLLDHILLAFLHDTGRGTERVFQEHPLIRLRAPFDLVVANSKVIADLNRRHPSDMLDLSARVQALMVPFPQVDASHRLRSHRALKAASLGAASSCIAALWVAALSLLFTLYEVFQATISDTTFPLRLSWL